MIYTCTLNPAIDYRLEVDDFQLGKLNRATFNKFSAGGKGINVSLVLKALGLESIALGFMGGFTGIYLQQYLTEVHQLKNDYTIIKAPTRINVKLASKENTEINAVAPTVSREERDLLIGKIDQLTEKDLLVLAGSSIEADDNFYELIAKTCAKNNVPFIIDAEEENLRKSIVHKPLLVKPNIHELERYYKVTINDEASIVTHAKKLVQEGANHVIVSLGRDGAYYVSKTHVYRAKPVEGIALNPVGAGDSMVAGFIFGMLENQSPKESFKLAVASGTAAAFSYDLASQEAVETILPNVEINEVPYED